MAVRIFSISAFLRNCRFSYLGDGRFTLSNGFSDICSFVFSHSKNPLKQYCNKSPNPARSQVLFSLELQNFASEHVKYEVLIFEQIHIQIDTLQIVARGSFSCQYFDMFPGHRIATILSVI